MLQIIQLFGRSPFAPLQGHMEKVSATVHELDRLFNALIKQDESKLQKIAETISSLEHAADILKNDIRNHLPSSLFLSIDRQTFLEMLHLQDNIADIAEDISVLITIRPMTLLETFKKEYLEFLQKNSTCFDAVHKIIKEMHELQESSFGGAEAEKVKAMCDQVAFLEHETDIIQRKALKSLFAAESELSYGLFFQWQKVFEATAAIANVSEKLANCVRMTLIIK